MKVAGKDRERHREVRSETRVLVDLRPEGRIVLIALVRIWDVEGGKKIHDQASYVGSSGRRSLNDPSLAEYSSQTFYTLCQLRDV